MNTIARIHSSLDFDPKGAILRQIELDAKIGDLRGFVRDIHSNYTIEHAVFGLNENLKPAELTEGYVECSFEYDNLEECLHDIRETNQCIFIESAFMINDEGTRYLKETFTLGTYKKVIGECNQTNKVIDLSNLSTVNIDEAFGTGHWKKLTKGDLVATLKYYDGPSQYGIDGGKISILEIRDKKRGTLEVNYSRDWDVRPEDKKSKGGYPDMDPNPATLAFYNDILKKYN